MTPQLQQAIRLLQLPALELQAHIRELLETNVMLEPMEETEGTGQFRDCWKNPSSRRARAEHQAAERAQESTVEVVDEGWGEHSVGPAEAPWNSGDDDRAAAGIRRRSAANRCRITCCGSSRSPSSSRANSR